MKYIGFFKRKFRITFFKKYGLLLKVENSVDKKKVKD